MCPSRTRWALRRWNSRLWLSDSPSEARGNFTYAERYEAARVDGANALQLFRHIILPGISPTLLLLVVLAAIFSFKQFTIIYLLTGGGPAGATETLVVRIYNTAFRFYDFSYSATLGVAGFLMAMSIVLVFIAAQKQDEAELGY